MVSSRHGEESAGARGGVAGRSVVGAQRQRKSQRVPPFALDGSAGDANYVVESSCPICRAVGREINSCRLASHASPRTKKANITNRLRWTQGTLAKSKAVSSKILLYKLNS